MNDEITQIRTLVDKKGFRSYKEAAYIGQLIQAFAGKYGEEECAKIKQGGLFGATSVACNTWVRAWKRVDKVIAECEKQNLNYDELGFSAGMKLVSCKLIRVNKAKPRKPKPNKPKITEPKPAKMEVTTLLIYLQNFIKKYNDLNIIELVNDVKNAAEHSDGFEKLKEILHILINPDKKPMAIVIRERSDIPDGQPSLKEVVYRLIQDHPEGMTLRQIINAIPSTGYKSHAKKLDGVVSQAINSLLMTREIGGIPQSNANAKLYKIS
jgi:hypothetical protein